MFEIKKRRQLSDDIVEFVVEAPRIAKHAQPGQFLIVIEGEKRERIPLTICDYDREAGTVTIVIQTVGKSSKRINDLQEGDSFEHIVGPLGRASELLELSDEEKEKERVLFIAGGVGAAPVYPQVKWAKEHGLKADCIIGARNKDLIILEDDMKDVADNLYICTDDGSYGFHGNVTQLLEDLIKNQGKEYTQAVAIGPMIMMKFAALKAKELGLPMTVSMNPIMVDGTGMCGACRVQVGDEIKFACVDGPEFDGHLVDFDQAMRRQTLYKTEEGRAYLKEKEGDTHSGGCGVCEEE